MHGFFDRLRRDAVLDVISLLNPAAAVGLLYGGLHGIGHFIGVERDMAVDVPGRAADGLDQRVPRSEESLLVGIQDGDEADFGKVESFAEQVDADDDVDFACAKLP